MSDFCKCSKVLRKIHNRFPSLDIKDGNGSVWNVFLQINEKLVFWSSCNRFGDYYVINYYINRNNYEGGCFYCSKQVFTIADLKKMNMLVKFSKSPHGSIYDYAVNYFKVNGEIV